MKIKNVGVIIQNFIQYESFLPAINEMKEKNINVDLLVPTCDVSEHIWDNMYKKTSDYFKENNILIKKGVQKDKKYDILFATHNLEEFKAQSRTYYIKYRYGIANKVRESATFRKNYLFDLILCYGKKDSDIFSNFIKTYEIGNIKYANYDYKTKHNKKPVILYLPTYGEYNSSEFIVPKLSKLKSKYDIRIKLHHGTNYLQNKEEKKISKLINKNFNKIYSSTDSLLNIFADVDIIITDNSGAIGDAIAARIPIILSPKNGVFVKYGNYATIGEELVEKGYAEMFDESKNLNDIIIKILSRDNSNILNDSFNLLYSCRNNETILKFDKFLEDLENGLITKDYQLIRKNMQLEYNNLVKLNEEYEIENERLNERLNNAYKIIDNLSKDK